MSPVDSNGFRWIESNGFRWTESSGFRWTLQDSCPVEILLDSAGLVQRKNMTEFRGLRPNIPDSAGLRQTKKANLALVTPRKSRLQVRRNPVESGGVQ